MPKIRLGFRSRLYFLIAIPLFAAYVISMAAGWLFFNSLIETAQNNSGPQTQTFQQILDTRLMVFSAATLVVGLTLIGLPLWLRDIQHPIQRLKAAAARISNGDLSTPVPQVGAELNDLALTLEHTRVYLRNMLAEATRQAKNEAELRVEARHNNDLSILLALSQLLLTHTDEHAILELTVQTAAELLHTHFSSVVLPDERTDVLAIRAVFGWPQSEVGHVLARGAESQTGYTLMTGQPVAVADYNVPLPFKVDLDASVTSGLSVPMTHENRIVGALFVHSKERRVFDQEDMRLLTLVANQTAAALERSRLYGQSMQQASELRTLARIGEALNRAETADITLRLVLTEALKLVNNDQGCIILVEPDGYTLRLYTWLGIPDRNVQEFNDRRFQKYHGIFARSIMHGETVELHEGTNGAEAPEYADTLLAQKVNVPLKTEDKTIGVIALNGLPVDDAARRMLLALADLAATAIAKTRLYERTQMLAMTDDLTGLYNRRGFFEFGQREFERARRFGRPLSCVMFDIDHFKNVNDSYGHNTGNQVLADLATNSREALREVDLLGRYGGEEFVVLLPESGIEGGLNAAERLRQRIASALFKTGRADLHLTISLGVAVLNELDTSLPHLIERADQALYSAKRNGRNRACLWSEPEAAPAPVEEPIPLKSPTIETSNK